MASNNWHDGKLTRTNEALRPPAAVNAGEPSNDGFPQSQSTVKQPRSEGFEGFRAGFAEFTTAASMRLFHANWRMKWTH